MTGGELPLLNIALVAGSELHASKHGRHGDWLV